MEKEHKSETNGWDVLKALINGLFNLVKLDKIICILVMYMIIRDAYFSFNIKDQDFYKNNIISSKLLQEIVTNDNMLVFVLVIIIIVLLAALIFSICSIIFVYKKEIERLSKVRSDLMHNKDGQNLKKHRTSSSRA